MPLNEEFNRYYARSQRHQTITLHDPVETIQSKLPVDGGELILTKTRIYLAVGDRGPDVPNVRLERSHPKSYPEAEYLEFASRMGAFLLPGQTGEGFLEFVLSFREEALERIASATVRSRGGIQRRYEEILDRASNETDLGKRKATLNNLYTAVPNRAEAAEFLAELYFKEGNHRAATIWLIRAGRFDEPFDRSLDRVLRPRLPSREVPSPEWWLDHHLMPLLAYPEGTGPSLAQRERIRAARHRIQAFRESSGKISILAGLAFVATLAGWIFLLIHAPWITLGVTTIAAVATGLSTGLRARRLRPPKR